MAIPPSGPLGFSAINTELGLAPNAANSSINSPVYRTLANVPSGQISVSDFYGKSPVVALDVEYMVISGGGGGSGWAGGGGGAGGLLTNVCSPFESSSGIATGPNILNLSYESGQSYAITVGAGGPGGFYTPPNTIDIIGRNGGTSRICAVAPNPFDTREVCGGGGAGGGSSPNPVAIEYSYANIGGSGGGMGGKAPSSLCGLTCFGVGPPIDSFSGNLGLCFGSNGGQGANLSLGGAGGGGGGVWSSGGQAASCLEGGDGGTGIIWRDIVCVGGGGGGGTCRLNGVGGLGGRTNLDFGIEIGGCGASGPTPGFCTRGGDGITFSGSGGGGSSGCANGGSGGSGMVVIGYPGTNQYATGGDCICISNGKTYHIFCNSGTFIWN